MGWLAVPVPGDTQDTGGSTGGDSKLSVVLLTDAEVVFFLLPLPSGVALVVLTMLVRAMQAADIVQRCCIIQTLPNYSTIELGLLCAVVTVVHRFIHNLR